MATVLIVALSLLDLTRLFFKHILGWPLRWLLGIQVRAQETPIPAATSWPTRHNSPGLVPCRVDGAAGGAGGGE